jgi:hypothetical protein
LWGLRIIIIYPLHYSIMYLPYSSSNSIQFPGMTRD